MGATDPWDSKTVIGLFCDPYVANTELEGGFPEETLADVSGWLGQLAASLDGPVHKAVEEAGSLFGQGAELARAGRDAFSSAEASAEWCSTLRGKLEQLETGQMFLVPGGWRTKKGGHAIIYVWQRQSGHEFSFAVCNTGQGVGDHPMDAGADVFPKEKHVTSWRILGVPCEKVFDELWLHSLFVMYFVPKPYHGPELFYEVLMPMLLPSGDLRRGTDRSWMVPATLQRAGSCYYKCCPAALRLILGTRGIEQSDRKRVFYRLRLKQLQVIDEKLSAVEPLSLERSDFMVIECACGQVARKALREERTGLPSSEMHTARALIASVDGKVAAAHDAKRAALAKEAAGVCAGAPPDMVGFADFPGWELLSIPWSNKANRSAVRHLMGSKSVHRLPDHIDIARLRQLEGSELLHATCTVCDGLEDNGEDILPKLRIAAIIEEVITRQFQPSDARWQELEYTKLEQSNLLGTIYRLAQHYVSAIATATTPRRQIAAQVLTMRALHCAFETLLRKPASDGMLPTTEALLEPGGAKKPDWYCLGEADLFGRGPAAATEGLPLSSPDFAAVRDALQRHPSSTGSGGSAWNRDIRALKFKALSMKDTQDLIADLTRKVLLVEPGTNPPAYSDDWPKWTIPFCWAFDMYGKIANQAPEFGWWRDLTVWCKYMCLNSESRGFDGVFKASDAAIDWQVGYCEPCELLKAQPTSLRGSIKFKMLSEGKVASSGATLSACGVPGKPKTEDDVVHAPTLPDFGKAFAQEEAEVILSALTAPYIRVPVVLHFLAADRLHALRQSTVQDLLWSVMFEPSIWVDDNAPPAVKTAPEENPRKVLGTSSGLLYNEVAKGYLGVSAPLVALCAQADELACVAPPDDFEGPASQIFLFVLRVSVRFLEQVRSQGIDDEDRIGKFAQFVEVIARKHLKRWVEAASQDVEARCRLHAHFVLSCATSDLKKQENLTCLMGSSAYVLSWYEKRFGDDFGTEMQMLFEVLQRRRQEVITILSDMDDAARKRTLDSVARTASNYFAGDTIWKDEDGKPGLFRCAKHGGAAVYDTQTFTLWLESGLLRPIPPGLQRDPTFHEYFSRHPAALAPACRPVLLTDFCEIYSVQDDDEVTLNLQWWKERKHLMVKPTDDNGREYERTRDGGVLAPGLPWDGDGETRAVGPSMRFRRGDVGDWLRDEVGSAELVAIWERLQQFASKPGQDKEGEALEQVLQGGWLVQQRPRDRDPPEMVALKEDESCWLELRCVCRGLPSINAFAINDFGRHVYRSQVFSSNAAFSYAALKVMTDERKLPMMNPNFCGALVPMGPGTSLVVEDDGNRVWVPPKALRGLLPAVILEGYRFWMQCSRGGEVVFTGEPMHAQVYSGFTYELSVSVDKFGDGRVVRKLREGEVWILSSALHAPVGSLIAQFAAIIAPLETLSHVLFWVSESEDELKLVELPRLQLKFKPGPDPAGDGLRLFSKEFGSFYVLDRRGVHNAEAWNSATGDPRAADLAAHLACMPHAVVLRSTAGPIRILVSNADVERPQIKAKPFSTELVVDRSVLLGFGQRHFLFDFHESGSLLLTSSLNATLCLCLLKFLHREYTECARLVQSICFDESISADQERLMKMNIVLTGADRHPNAHALRLKLLLALAQHNPKHPWLKKSIPADYADYLVKLTHISRPCRLLLREEGALLRTMVEQESKFWPQAINRKSFADAALGGGSEATLNWGVRHPADERENYLGSESFKSRQRNHESGVWFEYLMVDKNERGKKREGLAGLIDFLEQLDDKDSWSGWCTLFTSVYAILTRVSHVTLGGSDAAVRLLRLALEKFWLRNVRLVDNPDSDSVRTLHALWGVLAMRLEGEERSLPSFSDLGKIQKKRGWGENIRLWETEEDNGGKDWISSMYVALSGGADCVGKMQRPIECRGDEDSCVLSFGDEDMPRFVPTPAPRLQDFSRSSASVADTDGTTLLMLGKPLDEIASKYVVAFEDADHVPPNPFPPERLQALPAGRTRIATQMIDRLQNGHGVFTDSAAERKGCGLSCVPRAEDLDEAGLAEAVNGIEELEKLVKDAWSADLAVVCQARKDAMLAGDAVPEDDADGTRFWLQRRSTLEMSLWLEWCLGAELDEGSGFEAILRKINPVMPGADRLGQAVLSLMLYVSRVAQCQLVLANLQGLLGTCKRLLKTGLGESGPTEVETLAVKTAQMLGAKRNYTDGSPTLSPAFLFFEYVTGFLVRKQQVALIRKFFEVAGGGGSLVAQMIMGAGKTTCIAPMLTLLLGNGGKLVLNIVPKALLAQTRDVMRKMFGQILAKQVVTLEFTRMMGQDDPFDVQLVKAHLFDAQRDAAVVCTTPAAIKSMFLRHLELLEMSSRSRTQISNYQADLKKATDSVARERLRRRIEEVQKDVQGNRVMAGFLADVLAMLRKNSCALIDEVDLVLHPLKSELNFPIGNFEMYDLGNERWNLAVHLLDALFLNDEGRAAAGTFFPEMRSGDGEVAAQVAGRISDLEVQIPAIVLEGYEALSLQKQPHLVLLDARFYHKRLRQPLAEWLACWILTRRFASKLRKAGVSLAQVTKFLADELGDLLGSALKRQVEDSAGKQVGKLLVLGREWLSQLLPHILSKVDRVQYGLLTEAELAKDENQKAPSSRRLLAVPFVAKDKPSPAAEFAQPDVLIGFTVLAYRYEALRLSDVVHMLSHLQQKAARESGPWSVRPTCVLFERWKELGAKRLLDRGPKSAVGDLGPVTWEAQFGDEWKPLSSKIKDLLQRTMARRETKVQFRAYGGQLYEIDLEQMVQKNVRSKKERKIRQVAEESRDKDSFKLPELQALAVSEDRAPEEAAKEDGDGGEGADEVPVEDKKDKKDGTAGHAKAACELLGPVPEIVLWYLLTMVFDAVLRQQPSKLSATGQELGSSMLFSSRIGFSGTPSSLLPEELGDCLFEAENEGEILSVLSDFRHVVPPLVEMPADWSPTGVLEMIALSEEPRFHALIDTGALVMGLTNEQVARLLIRKLPEEHYDGVAFFDDHDSQMIILRNTPQPQLLKEAGVPMDRRFTFFDQVHTTGTDTKQPLQCFAALTVSASMTFRDYAQGAWRMRGLGKGQKLRMLMTPELTKKVQGVVGKDDALDIHDVVSFLLCNGFDSEGKQFAALQLQNLATVWRRRALNKLMSGEDPKKREEMRSSVKAFLESLQFPIAEKAEQPQELHDRMREAANQQKRVMTDEEMAHCNELVEAAKGVDTGGGSLGAEITRQQEKEQEKQQEKEKEVEVHVGRERESEIPWPLKILTSDSIPAEVFFKLSDFRMAGLKSRLKCNGVGLISSNHTANNLNSLNARRMKNVILLLVLPHASGLRTVAVSLAEAAALRRAAHLSSPDLPEGCHMWFRSNSKKMPEAAQELLNMSDLSSHSDAAAGMLRARRQDAARFLLKFFNCDLDFKPEEVNICVKSLEAAGTEPSHRQHFIETVLGARRREACAWRDTSLGEIVRGDGAKLAERQKLAARLYGSLTRVLHYKTAGVFFKVLDASGDGVVQYDEFFQTLNKLLPGEFSAGEARNLFQQADASGEGNVTSQDIAQLWRFGAVAGGGSEPPARVDDAPMDGEGDEGDDHRAGAGAMVADRPGTAGSAASGLSLGAAGEADGAAGEAAGVAGTPWDLPAARGRTLVESLCDEVKEASARRAALFAELAGSRDKGDHGAFIAQLKALASIGMAEAPDAQRSVLQVIECGESAAPMSKEASLFQLAVVSHVADDALLKSDLEDLYARAEGEDADVGFAVQAEKYIAKACVAWAQFQDTWSKTVDWPTSAESTPALLDIAKRHAASALVQLLVLERCHRIDPAAVSEHKGAEFVSSILLATLAEKKASAAETASKIVEWAVRLWARLVSLARDETKAQLQGPDFVEAANRVWTFAQESPGILAALCYVLESMAIKVHRWQITFDEGETWQDLDAERQLEIRRAQDKGLTVIHFSARGFPYSIDTEALVQTNLKSKRSRPIREIEVDIGAGGVADDDADGAAGAAEVLPAFEPMKWQVSNGRGGWWNFPPAVEQQLNAAKLAGLDSITVEIRGSNYEVDFTRMVQRNVETGTERAVCAKPLG